MTQPAVVDPRPIAKHAAARRRRRWPWVALVLAIVVVTALCAGLLWYASDVVADGASRAPRNAGYPLTVTTSNGKAVSYTTADGHGGLPPDEGLMGIASVFGGYAQTDAPTMTGASTTRQISTSVIGPAIAQSQSVTLDPWYYARNPRVGLGLDYDDVVYSDSVGTTSAWLIPGTSPTWVVYVHGLGTTPLEGLRIARTANSEGHPVLLVRIRDGVGDGYAGFGQDEWPDLEAAVQYALDHGADRVVLAGTGTGGSIALAFLQRSALASEVAGVFLDSPVVDARAAVEHHATARGVPAWAAGLASAVAGWRYGFDWGATNYTDSAATVSTPTLIIQGTADEQVPVASVERFATAAGPAISLEIVDGAGHGLSWNVDRTGYERALTGFLQRFA